MPLELLMPRFAPDGPPPVVLRWLVAEGQRVAAGDAVVEVESAKSVLQLEAFTAGVLLRRFVAPGERAQPYDLLGVLGEPGDDVAALEQRAARERARAREAGGNGRPG